MVCLRFLRDVTLFDTTTVFVNRQCSECDPSSDDDMEVDPEDTTPISQGRQRRVIKEPTKFTPDKGEVRLTETRTQVDSERIW